MKFDVKCVREMLLSTGEVYTVRKWKSKGKYGVVYFEDTCYMYEKIKPVKGIKSIREYVHKSGFDNVDDWWGAIQKFDALRGYLYHITLMEEEAPTQAVLPGTDEVLRQEMTDCDRFAGQMSNEEYANARQYFHSDDEQEA